MIRPATVSDISALAKVHIASWQAAYRGILPDEVLNNLSFEQFEDNWRKNFADSQRSNSVLEVENRIIGFIAFGNSRDHNKTTRIGEIYGLYLAPEFWGLGHGRTLWKGVLECLRENFSELILWVLKDNVRARRFYESVDFKLDRKRRNILLYDVELAEVRYRRNLQIINDGTTNQWT